jgi:hypothetical protein
MTLCSYLFDINSGALIAEVGFAEVGFGGVVFGGVVFVGVVFLLFSSI